MKTRLSLILILTSFFVFATFPALAGEKKTYSFKWANFSGPAAHVEVAHSIRIMTKLEKLTDGRMKFKNYMSGSLVSGSDMVEGTRMGVTDFATAYFPYHTGIDARFGIDILPGLWSDIPHAIRAERDLERIEFWNKKLLNPMNIQLLGIYIEGPSWLLGKKKQFRVPGDLKGYKIRCYGPLEEFFANHGATPIHLTAGELYESLMRGVVDGMTLTPGTVMTRKIYEVIDYLLAYPITISEACTWMNLDRWKEMSHEDQEIMRSTIMDMHHEFSLKTLEECSPRSEMMNFLEKRIQVYKPTPQEIALWVDALKPVREAYLEKLDPSAKEMFREYVAKIVNKHAK